MSEITVQLVDHMGDDLTVVNAARVSFDKESIWENFEKNDVNLWKLKKEDQKLLNYLAKHNHWSPFSHASASFRIKAPIFVARQLVKHTVGFSWNEVSRRYVDYEPEFYTPKKWRKRAENVKQGSSEEAVQLDMTEYWGDAYTQYDDFLVDVKHLYTKLLAQGVCPEQARMVLPQSTMTEWIWTGTLYAWARMCKLRLDSHSQKETRDVATQISIQMTNLFPESWKALKE